jgi:hypothetical protein
MHNQLPRPITIPGALLALQFSDNRVLTVEPLTYGRARLHIAAPCPDGSPNLDTSDDAF